MISIVTPEEMGAIDRAAPEPVEVLIGRAGGAVARVALACIGGGYGRRVVVVEGKGNNGNDGREAARRLRARGVGVVEVDAVDAPAELPDADLVIDAAYGTGFRGSYRAPAPYPGTPVLAVDIPSGVDGLTGAVGDDSRPSRAAITVTFAAQKPGLLLGDGADLTGQVVVADIGLDVSSARAHLLTGDDLAAALPERATDTHKWKSAVWVVGGSPGLEGAAVLTSRAAMRTGAGYVRWSSRGEVPTLGKPIEAVATELPRAGWAAEVLDGVGRFAAVAVGNGLGLDVDRGELRRLVAESPVPIVVDADALTALGTAVAGIDNPRAILTPHDGEYARLMDGPPGADRFAAVRELAARSGCVALLKGPTTLVAHPDGTVLASRAGDARLATLGSGDVLAGVVAALAAQGLEPQRAAAVGAFLHGRAAALGWRHGLVAGDLPDLVPDAWQQATASPIDDRSSDGS
jgi:NAD(P)H-hydrate epimerase